MIRGEAYLDIVWKQFRKNRIAYRMVWVIGALFAVAVLAPLIASNQPFWFREGDRILFPWLVSLFHGDSVIDFIFNMALLVSLPWGIAGILLQRAWRKRGVPARVRVGSLALLFLAALALACILFSWARPADRYFSRDFKKEQLAGRGAGTYALIAYGPFEQDLDGTFQPPLFRRAAAPARYRDGQIHLLGTDDSGRDILTRLIYGTRISMTIGVIAVSIYVTIGIIVGSIAGYFGGAVDIAISRIIEIVLLFPSFFLILTLVAFIGPSIYIIMVVIGVTGWPTTARLIRGEFLRQRAVDYVQAARGLGASHARIIFRHILPNAVAPAFVAVPFGIAGAIVTEATLSVLGFGVRPPTASWGSILNLAHGNYKLWWVTVFAGLSIFITVTVFNLAGNGLRDAMDPRLKGTQ